MQTLYNEIKDASGGFVTRKTRGHQNGEKQ